MIKRYLIKHKKSLIVLCSAVVASAVLFGAYVWHWEVRPPALEVHVIAADTSVAVFIRTPDNHTILIDGGATNTIIRNLTSLMPFYRRTIDSIVLTKDDDMHAGGLVDVLGRYRVGQVIEMGDTAKVASPSAAYLEFSKIIAEKNIPDKKVSAGDEISFENGAHGAVFGSALFPPAASLALTFTFSKTNQPQIALRIDYGVTSFFIADLSKTEQKFVASSTVFATASSSVVTNVLISQHIGGANTVNEFFFNALRPDYVVISKKPIAQRTSVSSSDSKISKKEKPKKPAFSIFDATSTKIINLATDGDVEFISDGNSVIKK